jgi:hypothetical protein
MHIVLHKQTSIFLSLVFLVMRKISKMFSFVNVEKFIVQHKQLKSVVKKAGNSTFDKIGLRMKPCIKCIKLKC